MNTSLTLKSGLLGIGLLLTTLTFAQKGKVDKNKVLDGKKYEVTFTEVKATGTPKAMPGIMVFKGGKLQCDLMEEKLKAPEMQYKITMDSTITEDDAEAHRITFTAEAEEAKTTYKWEADINDFEITGTLIMLKAGVEKKRFEYAGAEKTKKK